MAKGKASKWSPGAPGFCVVISGEQHGLALVVRLVDHREGRVVPHQVGLARLRRRRRINVGLKNIKALMLDILEPSEAKAGQYYEKRGGLRSTEAAF